MLCCLAVPSTLRAQPDPGRLLSVFDAAGFLNRGIVSFNPDGTAAVYLTPMGAPTTPVTRPEHVTMSRDGRKIAFHALVFMPSGLGNNRIFVMNADGTELKELLPRGTNHVINDLRPSISPDGTRVAFLSNRGALASFPESGIASSAFDVFIVNIDGTGLRQVTTSQFRPDFPAAFNKHSSIGACVWGPDNQTIAFRGERVHQRPNQPQTPPEKMRNALHTIQADGTDETLLIFIDGEEVISESSSIAGALDWSPDGRLLVWSHDASNNINLYRFYAFSGDTPPPLDYLDLNEGVRSSAGLHASPGTLRFSPDSGKLAFTSSETNGVWMNIIEVGGGNYRRFEPVLPPSPPFVTGARRISGIFFCVWWHGGSNFAEPASLTVPARTTISPGGRFAFNTQLRDAQGNLLSRSAIHYQAVGMGPGANAGAFQFGADWSSFTNDTSFGGSGTGPFDIVARHGPLTATNRVFVGTPRLGFSILPGSVSRSGNEVRAQLSVTNSGNGRCASPAFTAVTLNGVTNSGAFPPGFFNATVLQPRTATTSGSYRFANAGTNGQPGVLTVRGTFIGGTFNASLRLILP